MKFFKKFVIKVKSSDFNRVSMKCVCILSCQAEVTAHTINSIHMICSD